MEDWQTEKILRDLRLEMHNTEIEFDMRKSLTGYLINVFKSGCPRKIKDEAVLSMFTPEFRERVKYEAHERMIFEVIRRDGDIFKLIEGLMNTINNQHRQLIELMKDGHSKAY